MYVCMDMLVQSNLQELFLFLTKLLDLSMICDLVTHPIMNVHMQLAYSFLDGL